MSDLYELTRKLVERGCPEHPRLEWELGVSSWWYGSRIIHPVDARAIWTMWALEWWIKLGVAERSSVVINGMFITHLTEWGTDKSYGHGDSILDAIEAATRHLETDEHDEDFKHAEPGCS